MPVHLSFEDPTVIATYRARYVAEMAKGRLATEGIQAALATDDAGGAYPQLQSTRGVRLVVAGQEAHRAWHVLDDLDMLPADDGGRIFVGTERGVWRSLGRRLVGLGGLVVVAAAVGWVLSGSGVAVAVAGLGFALATIGGFIGQRGTEPSEASEYEGPDS